MLSSLGKTFFAALIMLPGLGFALGGDGRILATGAVTSLEGAAGGALNPFATITGYGAQGQHDFDGALSFVNTDDLDLRGLAVAYGYDDRIELSFAQNRVDVAGVTNLTLSTFGAKWRLGGDLIYGETPQMAVGVQYKRASDGARGTPGSARDDGLDAYFAISRLWLDGPFSRNFLLSANARASRARQLGLLGFADDYELELGLSSALFLNPRWAIGAEARFKREHDRVFDEDAWFDAFVAYFPNKKIAFTLGYADLGTVGALADQHGWYLSFKVNP
jgi:hypothetical protein